MAVTTDLSVPPPLQQLRDEGPVALFLDFDGTLVEIAPTHDSIAVPGDLAGRLEQLSDQCGGRCALVSGRSLEDLQTHLGVVNVARAGSHGASRVLADGQRIGEEPGRLDAAIYEELQEFAEGGPLEIEVKQHGAAIHYRAAPASEPAALAVASDIAERHGLALKRGKCVVELVRPGADKGGAVRAFMELPPFHGALPIFIGDDVTDEDGFKAAAEMGGFGIVVGERTETLAGYRLETVPDVYAWLTL